MNFKSHKTVKQIAKKHGVESSFILKQLKMGEPIEHEHTQDHDLALDIALQHLEEIPDYYTRLKKMESDAKKHPMKEHCGCEDDAVIELENKLKSIKDHSYDSIDKQMRIIMKKHGITAKQLHNAFVSKHDETPDDWIRSKSHNEEIEYQDSPITLGKRYCPKCGKNETQSECKYGPTYWALYSIPTKLKEEMEKDHEYSMIRSELSTIRNAVKRLQKKVKSGEGNVEAWVQSKITKAADYIDAAADYVDSGEMEESISFNIGAEHKTQQKIHKASNIASKGSTSGEKIAAKKAVQRLGGTAAELPKLRKEENLVNKILDELKEEDPCWKGYTQIGMKRKGGKEVPNCVPSKGVPKAKGYKKESVTIEDANGNIYAEVIDLITPEPIKGFKSQVKEATRLQAQTGNVIMVILNWRGKYYNLKMFFPQVKLPNRSDIQFELQKVYPGSKVVTHSVSDFTPGQPLIQPGFQGGSLGKPGPSKNYVKTMGEDFEIDEDWQSINRKDKTDGLSQKAVNAYRRENPGSKLKTAVTEKNPKGKRAKRRKSFCSRSAGQRDMHNIDCSETPDKPICKARRRWRC